jgi:hypothetical protein
MSDASLKKSFHVAAGDLLMTVLGLPVGLLMLVVSLLIILIFGCSLCLVLAAIMEHALMDGVVGSELLSDLQVSFIIFTISSLMVWASLKIVSSGLRRRHGLRQRRIA